MDFTKREVRRSGQGPLRGAGLGFAGRGCEGSAPFCGGNPRLAPGQTPYPYHSHAAQWEFYHVVSGRGTVRDDAGRTPIEAGDAFIYGPGEPHQLINDSPEDLVIYVVADNPIGESCYYPDSRKWLVRSPERRLLRAEALDYFDGEE